MKKVIHYGQQSTEKTPNSPPPPKVKEIEIHADRILHLISDVRLCRAMVSAAPATVLAIFQDIAETKKYKLPVETFAKNIVLEAMNNRDSFLFHESDGYDTGLLGYHKPLTTVMYGKQDMVEGIRTLLDPDGLRMMKWDSMQWKAYCRAILLTLNDCVNNRRFYDAHFLFIAIDRLKLALSDVYTLNGDANSCFGVFSSRKKLGRIRNNCCSGSESFN